MPANQVALLLFDLSLILVLARLFGAVARGLKQDAVVGEIIAGILLGPTLLHGYLPDHLFPTAVRPALTTLADLGIALFMFTVGLAIDHGLLRSARTKAAAIAGGSTAVPFALGVAVALWLVPRTHPANRLGFVLFMGLSMAVTAFPVLARILADRGLSRTRLGALSLSAAAVGDTLAWAMLAIVLSIAGIHSTPVWRVALAVPFIAAVLLAGRPLLARLMGPVEDEPAGSGIPTRGLAVVLAALLAAGAFMEWAGLDYIVGAFLVGVVVPRGEGDRTAVRIKERIEQVSTVLLMPVFFVIAGLGVNLATLGNGGLGALGLILAAAIGGKFAGAFAASRLVGVDTRQSIGMATLMNTRGLTEMVFLATGVQVGVLDHRTYSMMVIMALVTTMMTGPLISVVLRRDQQLTLPALSVTG
jgi:Kef-type K+ transport system membrane component KefB